MSKKNENPAGKRTSSADAKVKVAVEVAIAKRANAIGRGTKASGEHTLASFGAPVTSTQVQAYLAAMKSAKLTKASFVGAGKNYATLKDLIEVAKGEKRATALPVKTREAFVKLSDGLDKAHKAQGKVNKTWPRKHAIVLSAIFEAKPARATRTKATTKPVEVKVEQPVQEPVASA